LGHKFDCGLPGDKDRRFHVASVADLEGVLDALRPVYKGDDVSLCIVMGVCPVGLLRGFAVEAYRLHQAIEGGDPWPWPGGYYSQPAVFAEARGIMRAEEAKIAREDQLSGQQQREL
jgi:hypothetical protein